jgi:hypothetical protein
METLSQYMSGGSAAGLSMMENMGQAQTLPQRQQATQDTLSAQAELQKMHLAEAKQAGADKLAAISGLKQAQVGAEQTMETEQGNLAVYQKAIKDNSDKPGVVQILQGQLGEAEKRFKYAQEIKTKQETQQQEQVYSSIKKALVSPAEGATELRSLKDPYWNHVADQLDGTAPVDAYKKPISQLTPNERQEFESKVHRAFGGKPGEAASKDIEQARHDAETAKIRRDTEARMARYQDNTIALGREKLTNKKQTQQGKDLSKRDAALARLTIDQVKTVNSVDDKIRKTLQTEGVTAPDEMTDNWIMSNTPKISPEAGASIARLQKQRESLIEGFSSGREILTHGDKSKPTGSKKPSAADFG